jgi:hypothetical protein
MLMLTAPRIKVLSKYYFRQANIDDKEFAKSNHIIVEALAGNTHLTRSELAERLQAHGIATTDTIKLAHLMMWAELDGIICSGVRKGKQSTYALIDERVPKTPSLERYEALMRLTKLYFTSHGPATVKDFVWWSGLTVTDVKKGIELAKTELEHITIEDSTYWFSARQEHYAKTSPLLCLLPNYDEFVVGYTDRTALFGAQHTAKLDARANPLFQNTIMFDGQLIGTWKRDLKKQSVRVIPTFFIEPTKEMQTLFDKAVERFATYIGLPCL